MYVTPPVSPSKRLGGPTPNTGGSINSMGGSSVASGGGGGGGGSVTGAAGGSPAKLFASFGGEGSGGETEGRARSISEALQNGEQAAYSVSPKTDSLKGLKMPKPLTI